MQQAMTYRWMLDGRATTAQQREYRPTVGRPDIFSKLCVIDSIVNRNKNEKETNHRLQK